MGWGEHPLESRDLEGYCSSELKTASHSLQGLVVPVIRNVESMNYADIERTISELGEKVKWKAACVSASGRSGRGAGRGRPGKAGFTRGQCSGNQSLSVLGKVCRARDWQSPPGAKVYLSGSAQSRKSRALVTEDLIREGLLGKAKVLKASCLSSGVEAWPQGLS